MNNELEIKLKIIITEAENALAIINRPTNDEIKIKTVERVGVLLANEKGNVLSEPYTGLEHLPDGRYRMWYYGWGLHLSCTSKTGTPGSFTGANVQNPDGNYKQGYGGITAKKFKGDYYHVYNTAPQNGKVKKRFFISSSGYSWIEYSTHPELWLGEDHSFMVYNEDGKERLAMFSRPFIPQNGTKREISLLTSYDGTNWTNPITIFRPESNSLSEYYSMTCCQIRDIGFLACVNIYYPMNETVKMMLYKSQDLHNWEHLQSLDNADFKQSYGQISYDEVRDEVNILVSESKSQHGKNDAGFFQISRFKIKLV